MQPFEQLEHGNFYHIYNHGVGGRDLFLKPDNYEYFLALYDRYISPVAETYAWVLMPNHFHLLVRIKENIVYKYSNADRSIDAVRFEEIKWMTKDLSASEASDSVKFKDLSTDKASDSSTDSVKTPKPHLHFSHLFNAYSKYINIRHATHGALFERPFKRKLIDTTEYLRQVILYIHNNPVRHGFCEHPREYPWSSYLTCVSIKPTKLHRDAVVGWFDGEANFKTRHGETLNADEIDDWLAIN